MKQYKAIFIDWDDTIGDFIGAAKIALQEVYAMYHMEQYFDTYDEFYHLYHTHNLELWQLYGEDKVTKEFLWVDRFRWPIIHGSKTVARGTEDSLVLELQGIDELAYQIGEDFLRLTTAHFSLLPGAEDLVRSLAKKYPLVVLSNGFIEVQHEKIRRSGLIDCFAHVVLSEEVGCQKPNPRIYEVALEKCGMCAEDVLMIGDSWYSDIQGAINAGIDQMWVRWNRDSEKSPEQTPTYVVGSLVEAMEMLC